MAASLTASGLAMPASVSLQADVNTLDDYQEGTGTSIFIHSGSTYSYSDQALHYFKLGKNVTMSAYQAINASNNSFSGTSGALQAGGLPFTVLNSSNYFGYTAIGYTYKIGWHKTTSGDLDADSSHVLANMRVEANQTYAFCLSCNGSAGLAYSIDGNDCITNSARLQWGGWYITAS